MRPPTTNPHIYTINPYGGNTTASNPLVAEVLVVMIHIGYSQVIQFSSQKLYSGGYDKGIVARDSID
jgi:hypothetical protein